MPRSRPAKKVVAEITAAARYMLFAARRPFGISFEAAGIGVSVFSIPILHPLQNIAIYIIETPSVGLLLPHRMGRVFGIAEMPSIVRQFISVVPKKIGCARTRAGRIFPLRLRGQAIAAVSFLGVQELDELLRV